MRRGPLQDGSGKLYDPERQEAAQSFGLWPCEWVFGGNDPQIPEVAEYPRSRDMLEVQWITPQCFHSEMESSVGYSANSVPVYQRGAVEDKR